MNLLGSKYEKVSINTITTITIKTMRTGKYFIFQATQKKNQWNSVMTSLSEEEEEDEEERQLVVNENFTSSLMDFDDQFPGAQVKPQNSDL